MIKTHRANHGYLTWTSGNAKDCIRQLSNKGCIVQKVMLLDQPLIRVKDDVASQQLGEFTNVKRGHQLLAEISMCGCTVYREIREQ